MLKLDPVGSDYNISFEVRLQSFYGGMIAFNWAKM